MKTSDFDYNLPEELIAQTPIEPRDHSRMLVYNRADQSIQHLHFYDLPRFLKKGDVLAVAQVAGIQAAKHTWELIPMCHPLPLTGIDIQFSLQENPCKVEILATVSCTGVTGVEMEALTAVSTAALTIYDMCKAVQKDMTITGIRLLAKSGGKSGDYHAE